jgi:hypothetical protein
VIGLVLGILVILGLGMYYMVTVNEIDLKGFVKSNPIVKALRGIRIKKGKDEEKGLDLNHAVRKPEQAVLDSALQPDNANQKDMQDSDRRQQQALQQHTFESTYQEEIHRQETDAARQAAEEMDMPKKPEIRQSEEKASARKAEQAAELDDKREFSSRVFGYVLKSDDPLKNSSDNYFFAKNGEVIRGVSELKDALVKMDDFTFYYHVTAKENDFADWIENIYKNKALADEIRKSISKTEMIKLLEELMK